MAGTHCNHFSLEVEELKLPHSYVLLRVPIRRCALAEHMVHLLAQSQQGRTVARKLTLAASRAAFEGEGLAGEETLRVAFGPDLEAIHAQECTVSRCQQSCTPSYRLLLLEFGFEEEAGQISEKECLELLIVAERA